MSPGDLLALQRTAGNRAVQAALTAQRNGVGIADPAMGQALALTGNDHALAAKLALLVKAWGSARVAPFLAAFPKGLSDPTIAGEMVGFLDSGGEVEQAQFINDTFPDSPLQQRLLMGLFFNTPLDAKWAMRLAVNDVPKADGILAYLAQWDTKGGSAPALARSELDGVAGDVAAATVVMNVWATYSFDPELRTWVGRRAEELAGDTLAEHERQATARKQEFIKENAPAQPTIRRGRPNPTQTRALAKIKKVTEKAELVRQAEMEAAALLVPGWTKAEAGKMETFLTGATTGGATPAVAKSALQLANGNLPLATALLKVYVVPGLAVPDGPATAAWALGESGGSPEKVTAATGLLTRALARGLELASAKAVSAWLLKTALVLADQDLLIAAAAAAPTAWAKTAAFLANNAASLKEAVFVLDWSVKGGTVSIDKLVEWIEDRKVVDVRWALGSVIAKKGTATTAEAQRHLDLLEKAELELKDKKAKDAVDAILKKTKDLAEANRLLDKINPEGPKPSRLVAIMDLSPAINGEKILTWLTTHAISAEDLYGYLITKKLTHKTLDDLLAADATTWKLIKELLPEARDTKSETEEQAGQILLININKMPSADELKKQVIKYKGKHNTNMTRTVDAYLSHNNWDRGTFPDSIESLLYHYNKHVIGEGGGGGPSAQSVAAYSAASSGPLANWVHGHASAGGSWKITGPGGAAPGGIYTMARQTLSFWQV